MRRIVALAFVVLGLAAVTVPAAGASLCASSVSCLD